MIKRTAAFLAAASAVICCAFAFTACGDKENKEEETGGHRHNLKPVFENEVYGTADGDIAYYKCSECSQSFYDENAIQPLNYKDTDMLKREFAIENLDDGAVPQGITAYYSDYTDGENIAVKQQYFLISAYMDDGSASRIYVTGETSGYIGYVTLQNEDGSAHTGQTGGIATNGAYLWVGHGDSVLVATASEGYENVLKEIIAKALINESDKEEDKQSVKFTASFKANCKASFIGYFDDARYTDTTYDRLYVGEFYRSGDTDSKPYMYEYNVDRTSKPNPYGLVRIDNTDMDKTISDNVPKIQKIFSIPEKIQGVTFSGRRGGTILSDSNAMLVLSQSNGLSASHLLCFDWKAVNETANRKLYRSVSGGNSFEYKEVYRTNGDKKTPYTDSGLYVYYLNEKTTVKSYTMPPMSEAMCTVTKTGATAEEIKKIYVLFNSGLYKYNSLIGNGLNGVYSIFP